LYKYYASSILLLDIRQNSMSVCVKIFVNWFPEKIVRYLDFYQINYLLFLLKILTVFFVCFVTQLIN